MQGNYIEAKDILSATNGGLQIIFQLYPQAVGSEIQPNRKFKIRGDEKSASASLKQADDGNWLVTDFGGDSRPRNAIQCFMDEKGMTWVEAIRQLAVDYNVVSPETQQQLIRSDYSEKVAMPDDKEGEWSWDIRKSFTDSEIETIISSKVLSAVGWKKPIPPSMITEKGELKISDEDKVMAPYNKIRAIFEEYNWHALISYSLVKNRKVMTFASNEQYPIFLIDEGSHKKIYQPKHPDKARRFMYAGEKPKDFIHGLEQLTKVYNAKKKRLENEENDAKEMELEDSSDTKKSKKKESPKIEELVLCSGGSDAINVALLGYRVIWMNSETAKLPQYLYDKIMIMIDKLYQLPDIDTTGKRAAHELAMQYLDLYTIELPEALKERRDARNNPCKDLRDYLNHFTRKDFKLLFECALPYRFWEKKGRYEGRGENKFFAGWDYEFDNVQAYNFLAKNGFGRLTSGDKKTDWMYIRRVGNIVYEQHPNDIKNFIHAFLKERLHDKNLRNAMFRTTQLNEGSLSNLDVMDIDFTDNTAESQFIFFQNKTVEVTADEIKFHKAGTIERYIWEEDLLKHRIEEVKQAPFTITKNELNEYDIEIHDKKCPFFKYLVQTSRVHWRKELEERMDELFAPPDRAKYLEENHCVIDGKNLSAEEIEEQKAHLINKIFSIGYLLHRYKARNKAWFVWAMDNKINEDGKSHGGSGKSILFDMAMRIMMPKNFYMNGRNPKLTEDPHKYDGLTEHHRYVLIDDAHEYIKLDNFYTDITGDIKVNPKGKQPYSIPFKQSGKFAFTTNYTPREVGPSTERRMVYYVCSDYYHNKGETDDYRELRDPVTDLGMKLFDDFDHEQYNSFYNLMLYCLKFFLGTEEKMRPAMENVNKRNLLSVMANLHDWAKVYYSEESGRLDVFGVREEAYDDYCRYNGKKVTPQLFLNRLRAFCKYYGYILNPVEYQNKQGAIIKKTDAKVFIPSSGHWEVLTDAPKVTKEMFYIQSKNELPEPDAATKVAFKPVQATMEIPKYNPPSPDQDDDDTPF
ncbi:MAG TPA: primase-helicase family protein [Chitinophagaceae bacterium]|jgi:hypothetical protein